MKKSIHKNLITTGLTELKAKENDLFLGEWCFFNNKFKNKKKKIKVIYFDVNKKNLIKKVDIYLTSLYKKILPAVSLSLNFS